ncbi:MAG: threonine-phosphate decarboxylase CobD [Motiliproteus sp.]
MSPIPHHGGRLLEAASRFGIARERWLDLSTGINPSSYPITMPPLEVWQRLPESEDGLEQAAREYYRCPELLAVSGSQAAIQALPRLRPKGRVAVVSPAYSEHLLAWQQQGHDVAEIGGHEIDSCIDSLDVLVIINPNNPSGHHYQPKQLLSWHRRLAKRDGWLVVDEAFIDATPELSLSSIGPLPGLILLRSVGKFFGLAGIRCGFVLAEQRLLKWLQLLLGPWPVAGPSRYLCRLALNDSQWQQQNQAQLQQQSQRLKQLIESQLKLNSQGTLLFQSVTTAQANHYYETLARQGILVRVFEQHQLLRFGLPGPEADWKRLQQGLESLTQRNQTTNDLIALKQCPDRRSPDKQSPDKQHPELTDVEA